MSREVKFSLVSFIPSDQDDLTVSEETVGLPTTRCEPGSDKVARETEFRPRPLIKKSVCERKQSFKKLLYVRYRQFRNARCN